ncbi:hypothetical protein PV08_00083 [Exophiala spinifera]|uniref:Uncharacterized protein n=1 Tax=Exophiala spinifera TaxID=91928 RepID=A0A0D1YW91_9EURO|nr:uncharacterized protein PV08_00083 [Exophiala spinifera]KIW19511.1 hypothetical protein PV08_00083 [Exophiala spinifera]
MAPNPKGRPSKPHGRMVQPALPLIPGPKGKQNNKPAPAQVESEKIEPALKTSDAVNGGNQEHAEIVEALAKAHDVTTGGGEAEHVEDRALTQGSPIDTPQKPLTPLAQTANDNEPEDNISAGEDSLSQMADTQATSQDVSGHTSEQETAVDEQETVNLTNGHLANVSQPISSASGEDYDGQASALEPFAQVANERPTGAATANGNGASSSPQENGHMTPEETQPYGADQPEQVYGSNAKSQPEVNGVYDPIARKSSIPESVQQPRVSPGLIPLQDYLLQVSHTKEGVDWAIQVNPPGVQPYLLYAHSLLMLRSDRLRRLMQREPSSAYGGNIIHLYPARNAVPHAFDAALRFLYSDTVLSHLIQPHPGPDFHAARLQNLDYILSYWVAGIELGIDQVSACAERLLFNYVDWDILEVTYKHAIDLANSPVVSSRKNTTGSDYVVVSNAVIRPILHFLAARMDVSKFKIDLTGAPVHFPTRFPTVDGGRLKHKPALASMVFGSMPSSADMSPTSPQSEIVPATATFRDTVATNILLNIDFEHLFYFNSILQRSNIAGASQLMSSIITEREVRRQKVRNSRAVANKDRMANSTAWEVVGWKEEWDTETNLPKRERVGFLS